MSNNPLWVEFDLDELDSMPDRAVRALPRAIELVAIAAYGYIIEEAPSKTGHMRGSVQFPQKFKTLGFKIAIKAAYWIYVQFGSGLHGPHNKAYSIFPKRKKALKFVVSGKTVFAKYVTNHPGQKPNPFVDRGLDRATDDVSGAVAQALREASL
ncbi:MAG: HK97 gp10 family phage protein [FCB group bacterium]|nr:HK97 gp10 family phage protein [FCB group bacterium]